MNRETKQRHFTSQRLSRLMAMASIILTGITAAAAVKQNHTLAVEFSGCSRVLDVGDCQLTATQTLQLWIAVPISQPISISTDQQAAMIVSQERVQSGTLFRIDIPQDARLLTVDSAGKSWTLAISLYSPPEVLAATKLAIREDRSEEALATLRRSFPELESEWHGLARKTIGQALRRDGKNVAAMRSLETAVEQDTKAGLGAEAIKSATVLAYINLENGRDYSAARQLLEPMKIPVRGDAQSAYYLDYFLGLIAYNSGNSREAVRRLRLASMQAERMGKRAERSYAEFLLAVQLQQLGRRELAHSLLSLDSNIPDDANDCMRALHLTNQTWSQLLLLEANESSELPTQLAMDAYTASRDHCSDTEEANALTNLALAMLHAGDTDSALLFVIQAKNLSAKPRLYDKLWLLDIEARIAIERGDLSGAHQIYSDLEQLAGASLSASGQWRAMIGLAHVQHLMGDTETAASSYMKADRLLDEEVLSIPLDSGRETLLTLRARATAQHIALLLTINKEQEAFRVARRSRGRVLQSLVISEKIESLSSIQRNQWEKALSQYATMREAIDQKAGTSWALAADELAEQQAANRNLQQHMRDIVDDAISAIGVSSKVSLSEPVAGELMVLFHPLEQGWATFTHDGQELKVTRAECANSSNDVLAHCLLGSIRALVDKATLIRILPTGVLKSVDFHALQFGKGSLLEALPVVYSMDLGASASGSLAVESGNKLALLVGDADGDLSAAREEVQLVEAVLKENAGWQPNVLVGADANASAVIESLNQVGLFHYSGHARFDGELGWESELQLAQSTSVDVTDIVTLRHAPHLVVLSGCETARSYLDAQPEAIGLANAFIVAGSDYVVAAIRPVRDTTAKALVGIFYQEWSAGLPPHGALRQAQLKLKAADPDSDWQAYRLISRF